MSLDNDETDRVLEEEHPGPNDLESALVTVTLNDVIQHKPLVVESNSTLAAVIEAMQREDRGTVLVVEARKLVGIFTERDVLMKVAGHAIDLTRSQVSAFMTDGGFRMRSQQIFRCTKTFFPPNSRPNSGRFLPFGSERVCESDSLRHSVSISTFSLPAFTKKRAFAGRY